MDDLAYERNHVEAIIKQHEQEGAPELGWDAHIRLAEIVVGQEDGMTAAALLPQLVLSGMQHNALHDRVTALKHLISQSDIAGKGRDLTDRFSMSTDQESYILMRLLAGGAIGEGEYLVLLDELAEEIRRDDGRKASLMHILDQRDFREFPKLLLFISRDSQTPIAPLARLRPNGEAFKLLPMEFMIRRRVCAFDMMEGELFVAMLNPYSRKLRNRVQDKVTCNCKFFVAFPGEMDDALMLVQEAMTL
ncbi:MAG: hypothetical protein ISS35_09015 [Kiritimatiellae bacterium]|nr:hypothetical protein [Kiritimatiellia bacterium]